MYNMADYCSECEFLNTKDTKDGKYRCTKKNCYNASNCKDAKYCDYFSKKSTYNPFGNCYITTAVVNILGFDDNCYILNSMRKLRSYMQVNSKYSDLLLQYDVIGPNIAESLWNDPNREQVALDLVNLMKKIVEYMNDGLKDGAVCIYKQMTEDLMRDYNISGFIPEGIKESYDVSKGGHGRLVLKPIDHTRL